MEWRVGDEAVVTANHYPLGLVNGSRGRVSAVGTRGLTLETDAGQLTVAARHLDRRRARVRVRADLAQGTGDHRRSLTALKTEFVAGSHRHRWHGRQAVVAERDTAG